MYNILISGYYGFNNIGDESILRTVIDNLREKLPDIDITVLSQDPAQTSAKYGVKAARRMSLWDIFRSVLHCDLLLSGGGSLLSVAAGSGTYAHDAVVVAGGSNILSEMDGWVHVNSEVISKGNPQVIIVLHSSVEGTLDYGSMLENMSAEWKSTDAYKNGRVYLLTDDAADMAQRPSPRVAQLAELVARIIQPDVFADIEVPKVIGNDYRDYLVYSKNMDFNN